MVTPTTMVYICCNNELRSPLKHKPNKKLNTANVFGFALNPNANLMYASRFVFVSVNVLARGNPSKLVSIRGRQGWVYVSTST